MHVKASDIGKFKEVIYELLKNFISEHRISIYLHHPIIQEGWVYS